jgi:hypothetical protein
MKKPSINLKKAVLGVMTTLVAVPALACHLIKLETLQSQNLSEQDIQVLVDENILSKTEVTNQFSINKDRIENLVENSGDQELQSFLIWLKSIVGSGTDVNNPSCDDMVLSSQDNEPLVR